MPAIDDGMETVDRAAILVSGGGGVEKLLAVAKMQSGTGEAQSTACLRALEDWKLKAHVRGLVFDTTASNTGLNAGACTPIDRAFDYNLIWIGCRHHIFEVMLSNVFTTALGPTGGPEVKLFTRFKKHWRFINKASLMRGSEGLFSTDSEKNMRAEMCDYYRAVIDTKQSRDDYLELLNLCHVFLGGSMKTNVKF